MMVRWPRPDFLADPVVRRPGWVTWWAAGAVIVAATAGVDAWNTRRDLHAEQARLQRLQAQLPRTPIAAAPANPAGTTKRIAAAQAARALARLLAYPWPYVIGDLEAATPPGMQWLVLDHATDSPGLRLEGTAADLGTILRTADDLSAHPGWSNVALSRLQPPDAQDRSVDGAAWRFELRASIEVGRLLAARMTERPEHGRP